MEKKWCSMCREIKRLEEFNKGSGEYGRHANCKECRKERRILGPLKPKSDSINKYEMKGD